MIKYTCVRKRVLTFFLGGWGMKSFEFFQSINQNRDDRYKDADREKDTERGRRDRQKEQVLLLHMTVKSTVFALEEP